MRLAVRLLRSQWPALVESWLRRFVWDDPRVVFEDDAEPASFRNAMKAIHVGGTYKITGKSRHGAADDLLLRHVDLSGAHILDIGASDGSTSVDLVHRLPQDFGSYVIADLFLVVQRAMVGHNTLLFDTSGKCILVVGKRFLAWPELSRLASLVCSPATRKEHRVGAVRQDVLLLNPEARHLIENDPRVSYATHNVFEPWPGRAPDVIKVGNLLRRLYFSDTEICRALCVLLADLPEGGHLLVVDNPRVAGIALRAGLYRRVGRQFEVVALTPEEPEIVDLVTSSVVRLAHRA
ncbi:hypothetical protein [Lapillicoccus sp.]|uniref:hypothetical protein n=1 Tax=Lapillicoccus sp. TaxID=1909287 RepID=UPI003983CE1E